MWHSKKMIRIIILPCVISVVGATLVTILVMLSLTKSTPKIVTLDILGITDSFIAEQMQNNQPQDVLSQRVEAFSHKLDNILSTIAKQRQVVIVPKQATIAGAKDITVEVREQLSLIPQTKVGTKGD